MKENTPQNEYKEDDLQRKGAETVSKTVNNNEPEQEEEYGNEDKYLAMEQPGVTFTKDSESVHLSDEDYAKQNQGKFNAEGGNSEYAEAFKQDDYILEDNIDLDEDQNQSISSEDDDFEETNERY